MNDAQHVAYQAYLREIGNRLLLADWELELDRSCADNDTWAQVRISDTENFARLFVWWPGFFDMLTLEKQREYIVHECLHCHIDRPHRIMAQLAKLFPDNTATQFAKDAHNKETEICTQRFARLLAPHLPLPPEVKG